MRQLVQGIGVQPGGGLGRRYGLQAGHNGVRTVTDEKHSRQRPRPRHLPARRKLDGDVQRVRRYPDVFRQRIRGGRWMF